MKPTRLISILLPLLVSAVLGAQPTRYPYFSEQYQIPFPKAIPSGPDTVTVAIIGDVTTAPLQFTYDDATDVITFNLPMFYPEDGTPVTLTLNFARNE